MKTNVEGFTNKTIINQEAAQWVLLLEDTPKLSRKQVADLNAWVATSDVHRECLETMVTSWGEMDLLSAVMLPQEMRKPSMVMSILSYVFLPVVVLFSLLTAGIKQSKYLTRSMVAAPILLSALVWLAVVVNQPPVVTQGLVLTTKIGESLHHTMPDGSVLWLNSSTEIKVNYSNDYRRINLIKGEAHFEVAKNAARPFEVYADDRLVRAIGTAFSVHKINGNVEVLVTEGVVELAIIDNTLVVTPDDFQAIKIRSDFNTNIDSKPINMADVTHNTQPAKVKKMLGKLTAGQRISIPIKGSVASDIVELDSSEVTRFISWKEGKLVFAGESLEEVIQEITRHTEVKIDVLDPQLKSMRIGGQFQIGETDALFYVLESGFGISVNKLDDKHVQLRVKEK